MIATLRPLHAWDTAILVRLVGLIALRVDPALDVATQTMSGTDATHFQNCQLGALGAKYPLLARTRYKELIDLTWIHRNVPSLAAFVR